MTMTINERFKILRDELHLSQEAFAKELDMQRNSINLIENGKRNPSDRTIKDTCKRFDVSEMWLREGVGPKFRPPIELDNEMMILTTQLINTDDTFSKIVISQYLRLSSESKKTVKELILSIAKQYSDTKKDDPKTEPPFNDDLPK